MKISLLNGAFLFITYCCLRIGAQRLSPLKVTFSTQAPGPSVVVSVTATPPKNISIMWGFQWKYERVPVALVGIEPDLSTTLTMIDSEPIDRLNVRVFPAVVDENEYFFTSELTINSLRPDDDNLTISIFSNQVPKEYHPSLSLQVANCSSTTESLVAVETSDPHTPEPGYFSCVNGGILHFLNGTLLSPNETTCEAVKELFVEDTIQCWKAPQVALNGPLLVTEGSSLNFSCDYTDVVPIGTDSLFYFGDETFTVPKGKPFILEAVNASMDNSEITCQAITPLTMQLDESGLSATSRVSVQYPPFAEKPLSCTWTFNKTGSCDVTFNSNPPSRFVSLTRNGEKLTNGTTMLFMIDRNEDDTKKQTFYFKRMRVVAGDAGLYTLNVRSSVYPFQHSMSFRVSIVGFVEVNTASNRTGLIAGVTVAALVALLVLLVVVFVCCCRQTSKSASESDNMGSAGVNKKESETFIAMKPVETAAETTDKEDV